MEAFKNPFYIQEHFNGTLRIENGDVAKARADIIFDIFDTNNIYAHISDVEWLKKSPYYPLVKPENKLLDFFAEDENTTINLKFNDNYVMQFTEADMRVNEFQEFKNHSRYLSQSGEACSVDYALATYTFPLIGLIKTQSFTTFHTSRGFFRGTPQDDQWNSIKWDDDLLTVKTTLGEFTIYDAFVHKKIEDGKTYNGFIVARQSKLGCKLSLNGISLEEAEKNFREIARVIFLCLSLIEGNAIDWHTEEISLNNKNRNRINEKITYRWAISPNEKSLDNDRTQQHRKELRNYFPKIIEAYIALPTKERNEFDSVMRSYQLACKANIAEVKLIAWHSCLDLLKKQFGFGGMVFYEKLIEACRNQSVTYDDLRFIMGKDNPNKFRFNEIRDKFIHEGFLVEDYGELIEETRKMKALVERLILKKLKLDYRGSKLGLIY
jgi:hypothetical protein